MDVFYLQYAKSSGTRLFRFLSAEYLYALSLIMVISIMRQQASPIIEMEGEFAERPKSLEGKKVAYIDLGKPNGETLYDCLEEVFKEEFGIEEFDYFKKPHYSSPMPDDQIDEIVEWGAEAVVEAISDCGSCNSSSTVDAVTLEQQGIPTAQIITDEFIDINKQISQSHGYEEMPLVTVQHPTRYMTEEEVKDLSEKIKWSIITTLTCEECIDGQCSIDLEDS